MPQANSLKPKTKRKILKVAREKVYTEKNKIVITTNIALETMEARRQWNTTVNVRDNYHECGILYPGKINFKALGAINSSPAYLNYKYH